MEPGHLELVVDVHRDHGVCVSDRTVAALHEHLLAQQRDRVAGLSGGPCDRVLRGERPRSLVLVVSADSRAGELGAAVRGDSVHLKGMSGAC
eukprot:7822332-Pyramimonas_sp.AAC.1